MTAAARGAPHTLGIGTPGAVSRRTGRLKNSNTTCLNGMPFARDLRARLGRNLAIENDANCFALAEARAGAGQGRRVVFGVIIGTGCGGGIVIDGRVHGGLQSIAGEWGHTVIDPAGPACYCGARGCVETFISGSGLENRYAERAGARRPVDGIIAAWRAGEPAATATMDDFLARFGQGLANLIAVLDPDVVVLGGGLSNIDELYTRGVEEVRRRVFSDSLETPIVKHRSATRPASSAPRWSGSSDAGSLRRRRAVRAARPGARHRRRRLRPRRRARRPRRRRGARGLRRARLGLLSGNGLLTAVTLGRIAGAAAGGLA